MSFKESIKAKGYSKSDLMDRWGIKERQYYYILANPKQIHIDAVNGLPRKKKNAV